MRLLLTGGSGFIGTRLAAALIEAGHEIRIFDLAPSVAFPQFAQRGDVRDAVALRAALHGCDAAIDLAAEHRDDVRPRSLYAEVNVGGARNLVAAAEACGVRRLLFLSSVAVYGPSRDGCDETQAPDPRDAYGASKAAAEAVYAAWAAADAARSLTVLRPTVVFGEGNRGNVFTLIDQLRRGRFVMVGEGRERKSIAYVGNLVDFLLTRLDEAAGTHRYNYADKPDLTTGELVRAIRELLPAAPRLRAVPYPVALAGGHAFDVLAALLRRRLPISSSRVRKFVTPTVVATAALERSGFRARLSLRDALARTVASVLAADAP